jgi:hypothetical protein
MSKLDDIKQLLVLLATLGVEALLLIICIISAKWYLYSRNCIACDIYLCKNCFGGEINWISKQKY